MAAGPSRRRYKRLSRHDPRASKLRAGGGSTDGGNVGRFAAPQCFRFVDRRQPRGPRSEWVAPSMARPLGGEAPAHLSRWFLIKVLAYRLQSDAFGDLDKSIRRILRAGEEDGVGAHFDRRAPQTCEGLSLKVGALVVREWNGKLERVMILEEGFAWNGQTFGSLSQIAKAMTGTSWNGHRFFGLRQGKAAAADVGANRRKSRKTTAVRTANGASRGVPP
jgi:hypothetical protein